VSAKSGEITLGSGYGLVRWAAAWTGAGGSSISGDRHVAVELGGRALLGVVDGLGHGPEAARAAEAAVAACLSTGAGASVRELLSACHGALAGTRGAVATMAEIDRFGSLSWVGVGNIESVVLAAGGEEPSVHLEAVPGILGMRAPDPPDRRVRLGDGDVILMATDGVDSSFRWKVDARGDLGLIARRAVSLSAGGSDDALLLAARYLERVAP
jgi:negative regulator of sigma-B (phosphoserine phosphatase)